LILFSGEEWLQMVFDFHQESGFLQIISHCAGKPKGIVGCRGSSHYMQISAPLSGVACMLSEAALSCNGRSSPIRLEPRIKRINEVPKAIAQGKPFCGVPFNRMEITHGDAMSYGWKAAADFRFGTGRALVIFWSTGAPNRYSALRRNPTSWLIDRAFRYTLQFEEQRLDEDSGMAGLPGVSERDQ
jgi:hypothetical protein